MLVDVFLAKAKLQGVEVEITCGFRSFEEQTKLYNQVPKVTNAKAGESFHNYGLAIDVIFIKNGKRTYDGDWQKLGQIGKQCGLEWGGTWGQVGSNVKEISYTEEGNLELGFIDLPHFQYTAGYKITDFINNKVDYNRFK